ncbi:hypothetical protein FRC11_001719, partial [Ceratobasidium sp. 423]
MTSFIQETLSTIPGVDPRVLQRNHAFAGLNNGPAATASRLAGLVQEPHAKDGSPIYTSNFGQPIPDSGWVTILFIRWVLIAIGHALNIGGIPYQGDTLLLEKQQAFDRGVFVKYHWRSKQGTKEFTHEQPIEMCGEDPDFAKRDLWDHIENGGDARWTMFVQVFTPDDLGSGKLDLICLMSPRSGRVASSQCIKSE